MRMERKEEEGKKEGKEFRRTLGPDASRKPAR